MLDKIAAKKLALNVIGRGILVFTIDICFEKEFEYGWIFGYQSKEQLKTGKNGLGGNHPVLVDKYKERAYNVVPLLSTEEIIEVYSKYQSNEEELRKAFFFWTIP